MAKKIKYSVEEIAKYNAISVCGALQELAGIRYTTDQGMLYRDAMLLDLLTGAMERSGKEYDRICDVTFKAKNN